MEVTENMVQAFVKVIDSGEHNMFDAQSVLRQLYDNNEYETVSYLATSTGSVNTERYFKLLSAVSAHLSKKFN